MKNTLRAGEIIRSIIAVTAFVIFAVMLNIKAYGADFNVSISSSEATQGEDVIVTVNMDSDVKIGTYDLLMTYDSNVLKYVSGADNEDKENGGNLILYDDKDFNTSISRTIIFNAKATGSVKISVLQRGDLTDFDDNDLTLKVTDGTVTVKAPSTASSNANLSSLSLMAVKADGWSGSVNLMPDFSKDVTSYQLWLGSEFSKLSVSAVAEDGKAKIATAGTELTAGQDNTATVTVTAEDGTVKTYTIIVHVKAKPAEDTTTAAENNNTDAPTNAPADNPQDTTTGNDNPAGPADRNVTISEKPYTVVDVPEDMELPEGFERKAVSWNGIEVMGASDQSGTLTLLYLNNNETSESRFYVYNSEKSSYTAFVSYTITQRSYVMLMADDDLMFEGEKAAESKKLELTTLNIADDYVDAYKLKNAENIYIVKAMNWDNKIGYYYYSSADGSMIPYYETAVKVQDNNPAQSVTNSAKESDKTEVLFWIVVGLSVILMLIIVVLVVNVRRLSAKGREGGEADESDEFDEDDELDEYDEETDDELADQVVDDAKETEETYLADEIKETEEVNKTEALADTEDKKTDILPDAASEELTEKTEIQELIEEESTEQKSTVQESEEQKSIVQESEEQEATAQESEEQEPTEQESNAQEATAQDTTVEKFTEAAETQEEAKEEQPRHITEEQPTEDTNEKEITAEQTENREEQAMTDKPRKEKKEKKEKNKISKKEAAEKEAAEKKAVEKKAVEKKAAEKKAAEKEIAAKEAVPNKNTAEQKEENMSDQELDSAIDDILGQLYK